jgi:hypothetical protein
MNEDALRALVRETIARQLAREPGPAADAQPLQLTSHASHYRYVALPQGDGPCLIEPGVSCTHCGYCQSHGH